MRVLEHNNEAPLWFHGLNRSARTNYREPGHAPSDAMRALERFREPGRAAGKQG